MFITFIIQDMYRGGAQYVTSELANELAKFGNTVELLVSKTENDVELNHPELEPFPVNDSIQKVSLPFRKATLNTPKIAAYLKAIKPDVIISMSENYSFATALAISIFGLPTLHIPVEHSGGIGLDLKSRQKNFVARIYRFIARRQLLKTTSAYVAVSRGVKVAMHETYGIPLSEIHVIHNPVVGTAFEQKKQSNPQHKWLVKKTSKVVISAGAHVWIKDFSNLIRAFAIVLKSTESHLIIYGTGPETAGLKKLTSELGISDWVDFPGYSNTLPAEMRAADVFVVSSKAESFSNVIVEALASGTPVISTNCPSGPAEILQNGKYGVLVEPENCDKLASAILDKLNSNSAKEIPEESWLQYSSNRIALSYQDLLYKLLEVQAKNKNKQQ